MPPSTESERYLSALCRRSFLSLWSYPNLYTNEGKPPDRGKGRELCDLLVVFGDDVLIFSDKHVAYKNTGNVVTDWSRWRRRAVTASIKQLYGAESWLLHFPGRVFLDAGCQVRFPIALPGAEKARIHRIAVTRGSFQACREFFGGKGIGSLMISNEPDRDDAQPFLVGVGLPNKPFVHVLDEFTLDLLFQHLDTVADFVAYLRKKEQFLSKPGRLVMAAGEEQLLALYLRALNEEGDHDIVLPDGIPADVDGIHITEGYWEEMSAHPQMLAKLEADRVSYVWDELIEQFIRLGDFRHFAGEIDLNPTDRELALRQMAAEPRVRRRQLAVALREVLERSGPRRSYARVVASDQSPDMIYVLIAEAKPEEESYDAYRRYRIARLAAYCEVATLQFPQARKIVGFATDSHDPARRGRSEDLVTLDATNRTPEQIAEAKKLQQELGILLPENVQIEKYHTAEFPDIAQAQAPSEARGSDAMRRALAKAKKRKSKARKASQRRNRKK